MVDTQTVPADASAWIHLPALQQATYPDPAELERTLRHLSTLPPLVTSWEIRRLKGQLAEAAAGKRFLLQGGDCAEAFSECTPDIITNRLKVLMQMSLVLVYGLRKRVVRIGRLAGQYAKPRSSDTETKGGITLPAYRGDIVNGAEFTYESRIPDPNRMLRAYSKSALTLNFVRALGQGGFADMHHPEVWDLAWAQQSEMYAAYKKIVDNIRDALAFVETLNNAPIPDLERAEFFTSHEALLLPYEQALTRKVPRLVEPYNLGTHFPWIGLRTAQPDGAHVAYAQGIGNPLGVKIGAGMDRVWIRDLLTRLDPQREPGRLTLICRLGVNHVEDHLPRLIDDVRAAGYGHVLWISDPMHGNTQTSPSGYKTRRFEDILQELELSFKVHHAMGSRLGGVHFELTGEDVTECTGGARGLNDDGLKRAYRTQVDPRLNAEQALEMALRIVRTYQKLHG